MHKTDIFVSSDENTAADFSSATKHLDDLLGCERFELHTKDYGIESALKDVLAEDNKDLEKSTNTLKSRI